MIARAHQCRPQLLQLAVANDLSAPQLEELSAHVDACESCRLELEQLSGGREWESQVADSLRAPSFAAIDAEGETPEDDWLSLLEPSEAATKLGRIGKYEIESLIGQGGFGVVFKAFDPELNRFVAIKVLSSPLAHSAAARKRFRREACAAAAVVHDHVMPIHHVEHAGKVPYLVMPLIAGRSLQQRLDAEGMLATEEVLRIAMQTALGLAAAHRQGLIHRDIKPANILLENGIERVRISDFGLARTIDDATATQSGFIAGTPSYMAPEQARGESLDARADLFSLGSVMYAMCAGHPPFRAETTLAVLRRICDDQARDVRECNPHVPAWLAGIIARLLSKSPDDRFASAAEVAELLGRWLAHLQNPTVVAAPEPEQGSREAGEQGSRRAGENAGSGWRQLIVVAFSAAATLLIGTIGALGFISLSNAWNNTAVPGEEGRILTPSPAYETPSVPVKGAQTAAPVAATTAPQTVPYDQVQAELDAVSAATKEIISRLPTSYEAKANLEDEVRILDYQLQALERDLDRQ